MMTMVMMMVMMQEDLEGEWKKTPTNETIAEENDNDYSDGGETVYPDRHDDFRYHDNVDRTAVVKIQSNFRGYRARKNLSDSP